MKVRNNITKRDIKLATEILNTACPELDERKLIDALQSYNDNQDTEKKKKQNSYMLTKYQAAERLGISHFSVVRFLKAGQLPGKKIGGQWRLPADKIDQLITDSETF